MKALIDGKEVNVELKELLVIDFGDRHETFTRAQVTIEGKNLIASNPYRTYRIKVL